MVSAIHETSEPFFYLGKVDTYNGSQMEEFPAIAASTR